MSSLGLSQDELKAVEQTRQRLAQLDSLQASADILNHNLSAILEILAQNYELFSRVATHPSTNFPGRTQETALLLLLRKKPEPDVEAAMEEGSKALASMPLPAHLQPSNTLTTAAATPNNSHDKAKEDALEDIWAAARQMCHERIAEYVMNEENDPYTAEEREMGTENVRTGLRRNLDDDSDDEEDDDMEDVDGGGHTSQEPIDIDRPPPPPAPGISTQEVEGATPEAILRIATRGQFK
ncbi:mediator of RNA polymerase II transcription complex subunit 8-domain-containing protein [Astrocystis sublimbata]|nr:mediator of RNA polymerase II transcription complex subunit 8-domain-containing protein [Astrocystis sublimbata]